MIGKPIDDVTETDLRRLIEAGTPESRQLEYKRELPESNDSGAKKFLRAVTAFANTQGGDLIYGMDAPEGIPIQLAPLTIASTDLLLQRLEQLCANGVEPRLMGIQYKFVSMVEGGQALVVRVAKSWSAPHRVAVGGHAHFYGRNAAGAYPLGVGELRRAFTLSESVAERIRSFRAERLLLLGSGDAPVPLADGARVILHVVPLQSVTSDIRIDVTSRSQQQLQLLQQFAPPGDGGFSQRFNLDGRLNYRLFHDRKAIAHTLVFHNGAVEAVQVCEEWNGEKVILSLAYEKDILEVLRTYLPAMQGLGIAPPAYVFLTLLGVTGHRFAVNRRTERDQYSDRDALVIPEILIEDWTADPAEVMRPVFDMVWNAFGYERSFNYDENGRWSGR